MEFIDVVLIVLIGLVLIGGIAHTIDMINFEKKKNEGWDRIYRYGKENIWIDKKEIVENKAGDLTIKKLTRSIEL